MAYKVRHRGAIHFILLTLSIQFLESLIDYVMHTVLHTVEGRGGV